MSTPPRIPYRIRQVPDPADARTYLGTPDAFAWVKGAHGVVGVGKAATFTPTQSHPTAAAAKWLRDVSWQEVSGSAPASQAPPAPMAFVSLPFDPESSADQGGLVVAEVTLFVSEGGSWLVEAGQAAREALRPVADVLAASFECSRQPSAPATDGRITFDQGQLSADQWCEQVKLTTGHINAGDFVKAVLARDTIACSTKPWDLGNVLRQLADSYPACWTYSWGGLIGATPELLARQDTQSVMSRVLAGSVPQNDDPEQNLRARGELAASAKDRYEHQLAVESVEEVFAKFDLALAENRSHIVGLRNVAHLATDVHASANGQHSILDLVHELHPTAAVGGTPRQPATEWIRRAERMDRGRYAGPVGWVNAAGHGEVGLALRCGQLLPPSDQGLHQLQLFAGCGIVGASDPQSELAESEAKFDALRKILTANQREQTITR